MKRLCTASSEKGGKTFKSGFPWMGAAFIVVLAVLMLCGYGGAAFADDKTAAGVVSAGANGSTSIDVSMPYTGDADGNNSYTVQWKLCSAGSYAPADVINGANIASPYVVTITGLTPNTCYNIKATFNDADGVTGTNPQEIRIISTTDNTLLHNANRFPGTTKWGGNWGLPGGKYGQIDCETCHTPRSANIKGIAGSITRTDPNSTDNFPVNTVVFQSTTTPNGFGNDSDNHTTSTKVCEVCHTVTSYHRFNATSTNPRAELSLSHNNNLDCMACHPHAAGFLYTNTDCNSCHGNPPTADTFGPGGLASSPTTGSTTSGSHSFHATASGRNYACDICHYNSVGTGATHRDGSISLGFNNLLGAYSGGSYDGQTSAHYEATIGGTTVTNSGSKACSNIYCHGSTMAPNGGTNTSPVWGDNSSAACGTCHGATAANPPTRGSHAKHAGSAGGGRQLPCEDCHYGKTPSSIPSNMSTHVNNKADFAFDTTKTYIGSASYSGDDTMLNAYGTCSNMYCHSNVQGAGGTGNPSSYATVTWGGSVDCGSCHANMATDATNATGLHKTHAQTKGYVCNTCHNNAGAGTVKHADHNIDISFSSGGSYSLGSSVAAGSGYGTCSTVSCHSDGKGNYATVGWGSTPTGGCNACHLFPPATGAHLAHIQDASLLTPNTYGLAEVKSNSGNYAFGCGNCHPTDLSKHGDGSVEVSLNPADGGLLKSMNDASAAYNPSTKVCSGVYCHSNGAGGTNSNVAAAASPAWDGHLPTVNKCGSCHDNPPQYDGQSHYTANNYMGTEGGHFVAIHQDDIYTGTVGLATAGTTGSSSHGNPAIATTLSCYICHSTVVSSAKIDTYTLSNLSYDSDLKCNKCHTDSTPTPLQNGEILDKSLHVNGVKNIQLADNFTIKTRAQLREGSVLTLWQRVGTYKTDGSYDYSTLHSSDINMTTDGSGNTTVTCTAACHNGNTVTWGQKTTTCVLCHSL